MQGFTKRTGFICMGLIFITSILISCKKNEDFRDQYIGKYQTKHGVYYYGPCGNCSSETDTVISVYYGLTDSTINVLGLDIHLDSYGTYTAYHSGITFRNDSILATSMNGGLGCGQYVSFIGNRISKKP